MRARKLVGERNSREHEFAAQLRSFDAAKSGDQLGVGVLVAFCCLVFSLYVTHSKLVALLFVLSQSLWFTILRSGVRPLTKCTFVRRGSQNREVA